MAAWKLARGPQSSCGFNIFFPSSSLPAQAVGDEELSSDEFSYEYLSVSFPIKREFYRNKINIRNGRASSLRHYIFRWTVSIYDSETSLKLKIPPPI